MNSSSLRRSQRRRHTTYKKGDLVEIVHDSGVSTGRLLRKATSSSPSNPRWIFAYLDGRRKNEEVPEKSLGKVIDSDNNPSVQNKASVSDKKSKNRGRAESKKKGEEVETSTTSTSSDDGENSSNEKDAKAQKDPDTKPADASGKKRHIGSSSNLQAESISKKAKTVSFKPPPKSRQRTTRSTRASTRLSARNNPTEELIIPPTDLMPARRGSRRGGPRPTRKPEKNQEVVKVKMLTGTLYLYRGEHRRAEFIRFV